MNTSRISASSPLRSSNGGGMQSRTPIAPDQMRSIESRALMQDEESVARIKAQIRAVQQMRTDLDRKENIIRELQSRIQAASIELEHRSTTFARLESEHDALQKEFQRLQSDASVFRSEASNAKADFASLKSEYTGLKGELQRVQYEYHRLENEMQRRAAENSEADNIIRWLREELARKDRDKDEAIAEAQALQKELTTSTTVARESQIRYESAVRELRGELEILENRWARATSEHQRVLDATRSDADAVRNELEGLRSKYEHTRAQLDSAEIELDATRAELVASRQDLEGARKALEVTRFELDQRSRALDGASKNVDVSKRELDSTRVERDAYKSQLEACRRECDAIRSERDAAKRELDVTARELEVVRGRLEASDKRGDALGGELDALRIDARDASNRLEVLHRHYAESRKALESLRFEFSEEKRKNEVLLHQHARELDRLRAESEDDKSRDIDALQNAHRDELAAVRAELERVRGDCAHWQAIAEGNKKDAEHGRGQLDLSRETIETLRRELDSTRFELETRSRELVEARSEIERAGREIASVRSEKEKTRAECDSQVVAIRKASEATRKAVEAQSEENRKVLEAKITALEANVRSEKEVQALLRSDHAVFVRDAEKKEKIFRNESAALTRRFAGLLIQKKILSGWVSRYSRATADVRDLARVLSTTPSSASSMTTMTAAAAASASSSSSASSVASRLNLRSRFRAGVLAVIAARRFFRLLWDRDDEALSLVTSSEAALGASVTRLATRFRSSNASAMLNFASSSHPSSFLGSDLDSVDPSELVSRIRRSVLHLSGELHRKTELVSFLEGRVADLQRDLLQSVPLARFDALKAECEESRRTVSQLSEAHARAEHEARHATAALEELRTQVTVLQGELDEIKRHQEAEARERMEWAKARLELQYLRTVAETDLRKALDATLAGAVATSNGISSPGGSPELRGAYSAPYGTSDQLRAYVHRQEEDDRFEVAERERIRNSRAVDPSNSFWRGRI
eukprot:ANDGO_03927.mRNA.1 putative kinesin K39